MTIIEIALLIVGPLAGLLLGMMPAMGVAFTIILFFPILSGMPTYIIISFYISLLIASQFSGSVAAINLGLLGETTSLPALKERETLIKHHMQLTAVKHTAIGSIIATIVSLCVLMLALHFSIGFNALLRTDVLFFVILFTLMMLIFWQDNSIITNLIMIFVGLFLGAMGFDPEMNKHFFTFDNVYLAGGIPQWSLLLGLYAIPRMIKIWITPDPHMVVQKQTTAMPKFNLLSCWRGTLIGFISGMIPAIGLNISSNVAYMFEKRIHSKNNARESLARINSAESANNAAYISMLVPLLILSIPIQPSESLIYDLLIYKNWSLSNLFSITELPILLLCIFYAIILSYLSCTFFSTHISKVFIKYKKILCALLIIVMTINIIYLGWVADQSLYYFVMLLVNLLFGIALINHDMTPVLLAFLLQNQFGETFMRMLQLYGSVL